MRSNKSNGRVFKILNLIFICISKGEGTRQGTGKCSCSNGYTGEMCDQCKSGFFNESTSFERGVKCTECHLSCKSACIKIGTDGCVDCKDGWLFNEGKCEGIR